MQRQYLQHAHKTTPDEGGETASPQTGKNPQIYPDDFALCRNSGRNRRIDKAFEGACQYCGSQHTDGSNRYGAAGGKRDNWTEDFLTVNEYSRPGDPLTEVNNIFVHYTANPGTSAAQNRSYFEQLKDNHERSASAHFIIGYNGEIIQCVPLDEIAYAVQTRNEDSISIECCYKADNGQFTQETYDSLIRRLSWLIDAYELEPEDILRHYDCGGKKCPIYYTEHEDAWEQLKEDVKNL